MTDTTPMTTNTQPTDRPKRKHEDRARLAVGWWNTLQPRKLGNGTFIAEDRATLANLRRCRKLFALAVEPATAALFRALRFETARSSEKDLLCAAVLAGVLARVRTTAKGASLAQDMGRGERPVVSTVRMKRFMAAREPEDILWQFQRILAILGGTANVYDVAENVLAWLDETQAGDRARTRFAFKYHGTTLEYADDLDAVPVSAPETKT